MKSVNKKHTRLKCGVLAVDALISKKTSVNTLLYPFSYFFFLKTDVRHSISAEKKDNVA